MTNNSNISQFSRELEKLRNAYLEALPQKIRIAQKAWLKMDSQNWDANDFKQVYRLFHNIAGGAGTYGIMSISMHARMVLEVMKPGLDSKRLLTNEELDKINELVVLLENATTEEVLVTERKTNYLRKPTEWTVQVDAAVGEIFLVEDDMAQATYLSLMLKQAGHKVQVFNKLEDINAALKTSEPTAILMDMVFPEGNLAGASAVVQLQENRKMPIPIIFISTRTDLEARLSAVRAGAWHYFTKPVKINTLIQLLNGYINSNKEKKKHLLLVDDDPAISAFFASHLQEEDNIQTTILNEPHLVLEALDEVKTDLILMDYWMPECNGLELAAVIRQHEIYCDVPIVFLTEETNIETQLTALNIGGDDFLSKAIGPERVVLAVQSRLERIDRLKEAGARDGWLTN